MKEFSYIAVNPNGNRIKGVKKADSQDEVASFLNQNGLTVVSVNEKVGVDWDKIASTDIGGLPLKEKVVIVKQLSTMISAGIPLLQSLSILVKQAEKASLKEKLQNVYKAVEGGGSLSEAFEKEGGIFNEVQINLIAAGEKSGNLSEMLQQVAIDLEKSKNLRGKLVGAMIYPAVVFVILIVVVVVMITFMVPQIEDLYATLNTEGELPFQTQVLVSISGFFTNLANLIIIILFLIFSYIFFRFYYSSKGGKIVVDRLKLKIPVFGTLMRKIELVQFCRIFSMLLKSGIPIIDAIEIVSRAAGNATFKKTLEKAKERVTKGDSLSVSISKNNDYESFPEILIKIISTGEGSGKLDKVLSDMGQFYEDEVNQITGNLTKLLEPFILVVVGGMVAFLAIAVYSPLYDVMGSIQ